MKQVPYENRDVSQVFIRDCNIGRDEDGLMMNGKVEFVVRDASGSPHGPKIDMVAMVEVAESTTLKEASALLINRAMELVQRIAREPIETLIEMEALPFDEKFKRSETDD